MDEKRVARRKWVEQYFASTNAMVKRGRPIDPWFSCPVCGYPTLKARGDFQGCSLCNWEDDGQDDPDLGFSGPNGDYTLAEARANWESHATMYRPGSRGFEMAMTDLPVRRVVVSIFEAIREIDYRSHFRIRQLWRMAAELTGAAYVVRDRTDG